jgi:hypothetical protein
MTSAGPFTEAIRLAFVDRDHDRGNADAISWSNTLVKARSGENLFSPDE